MGPGFVAEAEAGHVAGLCGTLLARPPDRVAFPEIERARALLPSAQVERLKEVAYGLAGRAPARSGLEALTRLFQEHPEIVPHVHGLVERLVEEHSQDRSVELSGEEREK